MLKLKAEAELARLENAAAARSPSPRDTKQPPGKTTRGMPQAAKAKPVDPKQIKQGYQKAIELSPRAVEQMEHAVKIAQTEESSGCLPAG